MLVERGEWIASEGNAYDKAEACSAWLNEAEVEEAILPWADGMIMALLTEQRCQWRHIKGVYLSGKGGPNYEDDYSSE